MPLLETSLKAVLFDLDGTLLDTAEDFIFVVNKLLAEEGQEALDANKIRNTVSNGANALIQLAFDLAPEEEGFQALRHRLLDIYADNLSQHTLPFQGITETLEFLKQNNIAWGIVTNKPEVYTMPLIKAMDFPTPPGTIICPEHVKERKPNPESLYLACKQLNCTANEAVYLGDHLRDIQAGINASMPTIACAYGYIDPQENIDEWQADHIIHSAHDTIAILQEHYL